mmetsp:Transcript_1152/g.3610  ORF Transcript_1152/g.3610 Transcript_1152/m.3610 type:complete len:106 (-) Transcript_1152:429-746(-)
MLCCVQMAEEKVQCSVTEMRETEQRKIRELEIASSERIRKKKQELEELERREVPALPPLFPAPHTKPDGQGRAGGAGSAAEEEEDTIGQEQRNQRSGPDSRWLRG